MRRDVWVIPLPAVQFPILAAGRYPPMPAVFRATKKVAEKLSSSCRPPSSSARVGNQTMRLQLQRAWGQRSASSLSQPGVAGPEPAAAGTPIPIDAEWDNAFMRVESYLRAHHIESRSLLTRLTTEILAEARALVPMAAGESPLETSMRVAQTRIGNWLQRSVGDGTWSDERFRA